ncbi:hypothetical protein [Nostoc sp.]|uniref:hypothetical protein n=1 Tax=Nostoc sp. TaxID=1180 RepID=UPI002FF9D2B0
MVSKSDRKAQTLLRWQLVFIIRRSQQTKMNSEATSVNPEVVFANPEATSANSASNLRKWHQRAIA